MYTYWQPLSLHDALPICGSCVATAKAPCRCGEAPLTPRQPGIGHDRGNCPPTTGVPTMNPTHTDNLKSNLGEASDHLKQAAGHASDAFRSAASVAGDEARLGKAQVKADLARSEEHTSELQSLMRNQYAVFCLK